MNEACNEFCIASHQCGIDIQFCTLICRGKTMHIKTKRIILEFFVYKMQTILTRLLLSTTCSMHCILGSGTVDFALNWIKCKNDRILCSWRMPDTVQQMHANQQYSLRCSFLLFPSMNHMNWSNGQWISTNFYSNLNDL